MPPPPPQLFFLLPHYSVFCPAPQALPSHGHNPSCSPAEYIWNNLGTMEHGEGAGHRYLWPDAPSPHRCLRNLRSRRPREGRNRGK